MHPLSLSFPSFIAILQPFMENKLGRKLLLTGPLLIAGVALLVTSGIDQSHSGNEVICNEQRKQIRKEKTFSGWIITCAWIGTVACSVAFGVGYTYTKASHF